MVTEKYELRNFSYKIQQNRSLIKKNTLLPHATPGGEDLFLSHQLINLREVDL